MLLQVCQNGKIYCMLHKKIRSSCLEASIKIWYDGIRAIHYLVYQERSGEDE